MDAIAIAAAALVGNPDQVLAKLRAYIDLGIGAFILSASNPCGRIAPIGRATSASSAGSAGFQPAAHPAWRAPALHASCTHRA